MKKLLIAILVLTFLIGMVSSAMASGYAPAPGAGSGVHGGYATGQSKCKACHAVHDAQTAAPGGFKLLRTVGTANKKGACDYCHYGTDGTDGLIASKLPYENAAPVAEHTLGTALAAIPDSSQAGGMLGLDNVLSCDDCHKQAPHGYWASQEAGSDKLTGFDLALADNTRNFCAQCHDYNAQTAKNLRSHYMGVDLTGKAPGAGADGTKSCRACHANTGGGAGYKFPHQSQATLFVTNNADFDPSTNKLDHLCITCHQSGGVSGVGLTF